MARSWPLDNQLETVMHKEPKLRLMRRTAGHIAARTDEMPLGSVAEPRKGKVKLKMRTALTAVITGIAAGCKGLGEVEALTDWLGRGARKLLRIWRRVPDTTLRDLLVQLEPEEIRKLIRHGMRQANRRKQLKQDLPIRAASMDGKATSTRLWDRVTAAVKYGQIQGKRAVVRTITTCYVSVRGRPCLDAHPVPPETNEMGVFVAALDALLAAYAWLRLELIMYDSGACSLANADAIKQRELDYLLCLTENQPTLLCEAQRLLGSLTVDQCIAQTTDLDGGEVVIRRLYLTDKMAGYLDWKHLRTVVRLQCERIDKTSGEVSVEDRYYLASLTHDRLTGEQWLLLIRRRWSVENENHNTFNTVLHEDSRPWILEPRGMLVVMLLRRLTYNMLTLYRSATLRSEASRSQPWATLMRSIHNSLIKATEEAMAGLRRRKVVAD